MGQAVDQDVYSLCRLASRAGAIKGRVKGVVPVSREAVKVLPGAHTFFAAARFPLALLPLIPINVLGVTYERRIAALCAILGHPPGSHACPVCRRGNVSCPSPAQQGVDGLNNAIARIGPRADPMTQLSGRDGDDLQGMGDDLDTFQGKGGIERRVGNAAQHILTRQGDYDPAPIGVIQRRLNDDHEGNGLSLAPGISVNVELRH